MGEYTSAQILCRELRWYMVAWLLFTSATLTNSNTRDSMIKGAWARANSNLTTGAFPDHYNDATGSITDGTAG